MKIAVVASVVGHLVVIGGVMVVARQQPHLLPTSRVYTVDIVAAPGPVKGAAGPRRQAAPEPPTKARFRTGVKVESAPSNEAAAPRGVKKPKAAVEKPAKTPKGGGSGIGKGGGGGLRVEGVVFPYPGYLDTLTALVQEQWERRMLADTGQELKATVFFSLDRDGNVQECTVETASGVFEFDDAARKAVFQASPIKPLPSGFKGDGLSVHLDFYGD